MIREMGEGDVKERVGLVEHLRYKGNQLPSPLDKDLDSVIDLSNNWAFEVLKQKRFRREEGKG